MIFDAHTAAYELMSNNGFVISVTISIVLIFANTIVTFENTLDK